MILSKRYLQLSSTYLGTFKRISIFRACHRDPRTKRAQLPTTTSVTRWLDFFQYLAIYNIKKLPKTYKICQNSFKCCQTLNKPLTICQRFLKFCQSGKISPNLVTLLPTYLPMPFFLKGVPHSVSDLRFTSQGGVCNIKEKQTNFFFLRTFSQNLLL